MSSAIRPGSDRNLLVICVSLLIAGLAATGILHTKLGQLAWLQVIQTIESTSLPATDPTLQNSTEQLASLYEQEGFYPQARRLYEYLLPVNMQTFGPRSLEAAKYLAHLGYLCGLDQDRPSAVRYYDEALSILDRLSSNPDQDSKLPVIIDIYSEAIAIGKERFGKESPLVGRTMVALGSRYHNKGQLSKAEDIYKRAAAILERFEDDNVSAKSLLYCYGFLGDLYNKQDKFPAAVDAYKKAVTLGNERWGFEDGSSVSFTNELVKLYMRHQEWENAAKLIQLVLASRDNMRIADNVIVRQMRAELADARLHLSKAKKQ